MLISFTKRFIFVANTKAASTTIEMLLEKESQISITGTKYGKHIPYKTIVKNFGFIFDKSGIPMIDYFRFGVIREPLDWVVSWYNYRSRNLLRARNHPNSCHGISFEEFAKNVMKKKARRPQYAKIGTQFNMFKDKNGNLGVDYLIPLPRLEEDLRFIGTAFGIEQVIKPNTIKANASFKLIDVEDVADDLRQSLRTHFATDVELFRKAENNGFGDLKEIIRNTL